MLETAVATELSEHLGYDKHNPAGRNRGNSRNGTRAKTVLTEVGPVQIEVPRDREGSFEPGIVRKRQRRLDGIDQIVLSLTARGLTTGEVAVQFAEVYGAKVNRMAQRLLRMRSPGCSTHSVLGRVLRIFLGASGRSLVCCIDMT